MPWFDEGQTLIHSSDDPDIQAFTAGQSRWGHDGIFCTWEDDDEPPFRPHVYRLTGPFTILNVDDDQHGSGDILQGYCDDEIFLNLLKELGPEAGLTGEPPWHPPPGIYGVDYFRELHRLLRTRIKTKDGDGWWIGGEIVLWNYEKIRSIEKL